MNIKPIHTDADHRAPLAEIERLWDAAPGTPEFDQLDILATLVDGLRARACSHPAARSHRGDQVSTRAGGQDPQGAGALVGSRARVTEILNRTRRLTLRLGARGRPRAHRGGARETRQPHVEASRMLWRPWAPPR